MIIVFCFLVQLVDQVLVKFDCYVDYFLEGWVGCVIVGDMQLVVVLGKQVGSGKIGFDLW